MSYSLSRLLFRRVFTVVPVLTVILILSGCGTYEQFMGASPNESSNGPSGSVQSSAAQGMAVDTKKSNGNMQHHSDGMHKSSTGFKGPKIHSRNMFAEHLADPIERLQRIEHAVQKLRNDFDRAIPALAALIKSESELTQIIGDMKEAGFLNYMKEEDLARWKKAAHKLPQSVDGGDVPSDMKRKMADMRRLQSRYTADKAKSAASHGGNAQQQKQASVKLEMPSHPAVVGFRVGEHKDRTRLVLDMSVGSKYTYDLDNDENLLIIELPTLKWETKQAADYKAGRGVIRGYKAQVQNNTARLLVTLAKSTEVLNVMALKPEGNLPHRLVFDLGK